MSVYDLQHVTVTAVGNPAIGYRITSEPGWYIHCPEHDELVYKTAIAVRADYDFSTIQIVAAADLPEGAEILGGGNDNEHVTE